MSCQLINLTRRSNTYEFCTHVVYFHHFFLLLLETEKKIVQEAVLKAVEEERRNMEKIHEEERKMWEAERDRHEEKIAHAVREAMQEQRKHNQVSIFWTCSVCLMSL